MPEQLTKHPDVTLQVLKSAGANCGEGAPQQILKQCPAERFCALPGGEVCIYGLPDAKQMTQISAADFAAIAAQPAAPAASPPPGATTSLSGTSPEVAAWLVGGLVIGALFGRWSGRRRRIP